MILHYDASASFPLSAGTDSNASICSTEVAQGRSVKILSTAAVDAAAEAEIFGHFQELTAGRIEILISHRFSTVRRADLIVVMACDGCETILQAQAPSRPIARGLAGPGLLAHVLVSKYADHLPLYRQSVIYAREGVELDRSTLADWVGQSSALLRPLGETLAGHVLAAAKGHADDTPVPVLQPGAGRTKTARLWAYVRDDRPAADETPPAVLFRYSPDRRGVHPQTHLKAFRGVLQADAYAGFNALYGEHIVEAACWAHVRRKFYDLAQAGSAPLAEGALQRIAALYAIEAQIRGQPPAIQSRS